MKIDPLIRWRIKVKTVVVLASLAAMGLTASSAVGDVFSPTADAPVKQSTPASNFATAALRVDGGTGSAVESYLRFEVTGLSSVVSAKLRLYATSGSATGPVAYLTGNSWGETALNWSNKPARTSGGLGAPSRSVATNSWVEFDVSSLVAGNGTYSFVITTTSNDGIDFGSRESSTLKPELVVVQNASPPPPPPPAFGDPVIAGAGDIASCGNRNSEATAKLLDAISPTRVITLGDNSYPDGTPSNFADCYSSSWGRHKSNTSPASGNHDYHTTGASGYFSFFGASAGDPAKGYYAFDLGSWRLYALNSNCSDVPCSAGSAQEQWLRQDLAANPRSCKLAYMHHPRFASGSETLRRNNPSMAALYQAFYDASGDVWLTGHNHLYERLARLNPSGAVDATRGIRNFVVGTGGASLYQFGPPIAGSEVRNNSTYGVIKLTLRPSSYTWEFVPIAGQTFTDSGTESCDSAQDPIPPPAPVTRTVTAEADSQVSESASSTNYGSSTRLLVDGGSDPDTESYLRFTVSGLSGTVSSAKVRVFAVDPTADGPAISGTSSSWTESGITWSNRPTRTTAAMGDKGSIATDTWAEYDVKSIVTGNGTYSFVLATTSNDGIDFSSRTGASPPQLVVTSG